MNDRPLRRNAETNIRTIPLVCRQSLGSIKRAGFGIVFGTVLLLNAAVLAADEPAPSPKPADSSPPALNSPLSPQESLKQFHLHPDLRIELVAAEPEVTDPVAIAFDEYGRLWIAEMRDYPNGPPEGQPPLSRIRVLEDRDHDGYYETSHIFADGLLFANGVQPWRGGVIVTLSGAVAYLRDTNGDGRADLRETWFTGFAEKNPQLRANHPTFALDNHIYVANGLRGGDVIARKQDWVVKVGAQRSPQQVRQSAPKPVSISGMDFRFDPVRGTYEAVSGVGQFGLTFDDFCNRFVCSNRNPCRQIVLEDRYIKRNPHLAVESVAQDVSPSGAESRVFPISQTWTTSTLHTGQFTAACGVTIYRGDRLPSQFRGNSFTCEPTGNLVHRDVLKPQGATFTSQPGRDGVEFLATRDQWSRPVNLANGPDGALYVVDMYRAVIEHPQFMPDELKNRPDLRDGDDRGRIYRIVPAAGAGHRQQGIRLAEMSSAELVRLLAHPNAWQRETAARLLIERQDRSVQDDLIALSRNGKTPQARIHALWLLNGLGILPAAVLRRALDDEHPRVREQAVRLSEPLLNTDAPLRKKLLALAEDHDARVRFQAALSLGEARVDADVVEALAAIAVRSSQDPWTRRAVASSVSNEPAELLQTIYQRISAGNKWADPGIADLVRELSAIIGSRQTPEEIAVALAPDEKHSALSASHSAWHVRLAGLNGLGEGLNRRGKTVSSFLEQLPQSVKREADALFTQAAELAPSKEAPLTLRLEAVNALAHAGYDVAGPPLKALIQNEANQTVLLAAIDSLAAHDDPEIASVLLTDFGSQLPPIRRATLDAMLVNTARTRTLLEEIEAGRLAVTELDPTRRNRLSRHRNSEIRNLAKRLLADAVPEDRKTVLKNYQPALSLSADPLRGREVFRKNCTQCHRIGDLGVDVAPDIADSRTKTPDELLVSILDPNRAIDNNYFSYTLVTNQGRVFTGIIAAETASSITLRQPENKTVTLLRRDLAAIHSDRVSLMPVGLEKDVTVQQMADLISFIKNWRYLNGEVPIKVGR